jgi:hypothetical protein
MVDVHGTSQTPNSDSLTPVLHSARRLRGYRDSGFTNSLVVSLSSTRTLKCRTPTLHNPWTRVLQVNGPDRIGKSRIAISREIMDRDSYMQEFLAFGKPDAPNADSSRSLATRPAKIYG